MSHEHDDSELAGTTLRCPDCGGLVSNDDDATERTVHCAECDETFHLLLVPIDRSTSAGCPACGGNLTMNDFGDPLTCKSCGKAWTVQERSWLHAVDPD